MMKKTKITVLFAVLLLVMALPMGVHADHIYGDPDWGVTFTAQEKMDSNFSLEEYNDKIEGMQPGDDVTITLKIKNTHPEETAWYMTNTVLKSLEDASKTAKSGAYTYVLTYQGPSTSLTLFDSDTVGGESSDKDNGGEGLNAISDVLSENDEDYFYLDNLTSGQEGVITLKVALDGETQGNDYQDTLARLQMSFAVELHKPGEVPPPPKNPPRNTTVVITGENIHPTTLFLIAGISGAVVLVLAILGLRLKKSEKKEAAA